MSDQPSASPDIDDQLRKTRLELLDIGLRNPLVNFRRTRKTLAVQNADPGELLGRLLEEQKPLGFLAKGQAAGAAAEQQLNEIFLDTLADTAAAAPDAGEASAERSAACGPEDATPPTGSAAAGVDHGLAEVAGGLSAPDVGADAASRPSDAGAGAGSGIAAAGRLTEAGIHAGTSAIALSLNDGDSAGPGTAAVGTGIDPTGRAEDSPNPSAPSPAPAARTGPALLALGHTPAAATPARPAARGARRTPVIESALSRESLFLQLLKMRSEAQSFLEEQGANLLFLAVGFLHWFESDSAAEPRRAPLILIPCSLVREGASERFELEPTGDDVEINLSLAAKLKTDFGIALPMPAAQADDEDEPTAADWQAYLDRVAEAVAVQKRWRVVRDEAVLGFFSFGKFLMFKDLDGEHWPEGKKPAEHPVLRRLLGGGFGDTTPAHPEEVRIDEVIAPGELHFVKDADSSQTQALLEAREGRDLVIQGPPGTGKSQTITNLIAELIGQRKTVLFVSEKMAALEVVKRRLDECHIGDGVLELHSHRATKLKVLQELGRTLQLGRPTPATGERELARLKAVQEELNAYCRAVSAPIGQSGMDFTTVLGRLLTLQRDWPGLEPLAWEGLAGYDAERFGQASDLAQRMALVIEALGRPRDSAFWGSRLLTLTPPEESRIARELEQGQERVDALREAALQLSARLCLAAPVCLGDIAVIGRAARRAAQAPRLEGIRLSTQEWQQRREAIQALVQAGAAMQQQRSQWDGLLIEAAWTQDVLPIRQAIAGYGDKWWKFLAGPWREARRGLQGLLRQPAAMPPAQMLAMLDGILAYQRHRAVFADHAALGEMLFGAQWQGEASDWPVLERVSAWIAELHDAVGQGTLPQGIVDFLAGHPDASGLGEEADIMSSQATQVEDSVRALTGLLALPGQTADGQAWTALALEALAARLRAWREQLPRLHHLARFNTLAAAFEEAQLDAMLALAADCEQADTLLPCLELSRLHALVQEAYRAHPLLARFDRLEHEHRIGQFRSLDAASLAHSQHKLMHDLWQRLPGLNGPGEMGVLRHELNKKRRHMPIRRLIEHAGRAIQQIKPVFMMSPMSIASFLPPGKLEFDVVIFDEASQVKAVDALGAILRGRQVIVVGDTRQMPPTDFFGRDLEQDEDTATGDIESILSLFKAKGCNERYLRWHYRSRHESLIAVSNAEFYENRLVIFPSAGANPQATGIEHVHIPEAVYDRGRTRTNRLEAQAVARAVIEHARRNPALSLGVAAFSVAQRDLIEVEVEMLRRQHPEAEAFFSSHPHEPFFVKNLENIQGDERDVMFISIGYGRNETGRIAREFGPLNREGGHRRLNVLITRAKLAMRVFSNFRADELELDAGAGHGVRALKHLLRYAQTRELETVVETGRNTDSPFEDQVIQALRGQGYAIEPQVGTAGYFIDLAVRDPERPGRYLLAVECDGAAYHSARSARDRDRLRQAVLEGLGWRFHRIWSTDWFRSPERETERAVAAIQEAQRQQQAIDARQEEQARQIAQEALAATDSPSGPEPREAAAEGPAIAAGGADAVTVDALATPAASTESGSVVATEAADAAVTSTGLGAAATADASGAAMAPIGPEDADAAGIPGSAAIPTEAGAPAAAAPGAAMAPVGPGDAAAAGIPDTAAMPTEARDIGTAAAPDAAMAPTEAGVPDSAAIPTEAWDIGMATAPDAAMAPTEAGTSADPMAHTPPENPTGVLTTGATGAPAAAAAPVATPFPGSLPASASAPAPASTPARAEHTGTPSEPPQLSLRIADEQRVEVSHTVPYVAVALPVQDAELHQAPARLVQDLVAEIVAAEAPVHSALIVRRLTAAFGLSRAGSRVVGTVEQAIQREAQDRQWQVVDGFVMSAEQAAEPGRLPIRDRAQQPAAERKIEWVSPQEIQAALLKAVEISFSLSQPAAVSTVAQWLGFGRTSGKITSAVQAQCAELVRAGRLASAENSLLTLAPSARRAAA